MTTKRKNAPLEASNVAVLLEHIPIGATRAVHSLQVKRVEADHYSIAGGPVIDLVDAVAQIGSYSGHSAAKTSNPTVKEVRDFARAKLKELRKERAATTKRVRAEKAEARVAAQEARAHKARVKAATLKTGSEQKAQTRAEKAEALLEQYKRKLAYITAKAKKANPAAKFERGKAVGGGHREERGYFYEVLNSEGAVVAMTTSKAEAQEVCDNPTMIKLPRGKYTLRHVGGKSVVPATAGIRARKVK
jgi:hypothetical protein